MAQLRLTRSSSDKMITGVCGGLGDYLGVDSTVVRVAFVMLVLASGIGLPLYIVLTLVLPQESAAENEPLSKVIQDNLGSLGDTLGSSMDRAQENPNGRTFAAFILIGLGTYFLLEQFGWHSGGLLWPLVLVVLGIAIINRWRKDNN